MGHVADQDGADLGVATRVRPSRGDPLVVGVLWAPVACGLVAFAAVQVHPGVVERTAVGLVLLVAAGISLAFATRAQLLRAWRWVVPSVVVLVLVGMWNPWQLAAVSLLLDHPFAAGSALALIGVVLVLGAPTWSGRGGAHLGALLALLVMLASLQLVGAFTVLYLAPGPYAPDGFTGSDAAVRVDQHEGLEPLRCRVPLLRVGSGLTMREQMLAEACHAAVSVAATPAEVGVCVVTDYRNATRSRFDATTLAPLGDAEFFAVADGTPCPAYGDRP